MSKNGSGAAFCSSLNFGHRRNLIRGSGLSECATHLGMARGMNSHKRINTGIVFSRLGRRVGRRHKSSVGPFLYITLGAAPSFPMHSTRKGCMKSCPDDGIGPLHSVHASCGHAHVAHVFSANCTSVSVVGKLGLGRALDCSCGVRGSSHC